MKFVSKNTNSNGQENDKGQGGMGEMLVEEWRKNVFVVDKVSESVLLFQIHINKVVFEIKMTTTMIFVDMTFTLTLTVMVMKARAKKV